VKFVICDLCGREVAACSIKQHITRHQKEKPCLVCGNKINRGKFCNSSCAAKYNKNRKGTGVVRICICGKKVKSKYCSMKCKNNKEYNDFIEKWIRGDINGDKGIGTVSNHIRRWLLVRAENKCEGKMDDGSRCGWSRINPRTGLVPLTIHHDGGNWENNRPENLKVLCPCCHSLTPTYGNANKGKGRIGRKGGRKK
jgi:predicted nucleic acid-binding Zn ribbon protein